MKCAFSETRHTVMMSSRSSKAGMHCVQTHGSHQLGMPLYIQNWAAQTGKRTKRGTQKHHIFPQCSADTAGSNTREDHQRNASLQLHRPSKRPNICMQCIVRTITYSIQHTRHTHNIQNSRIQKKTLPLYSRPPRGARPKLKAAAPTK